MSFLIQFVPTLIILGVLIFVHELGHYLACLWSKVRVEKFSIGFGPEVVKWKWSHTVFAISLIPLGGFVKPAGESFSELNGKPPAEGDFIAASRWKRLCILLAGITMNYALAIVIFSVLFCVGQPVLKAKIGEFVAGYPAESSGLQVGDEITKVNGEDVTDWQDFTIKVFENTSPSLSLQVIRNGTPVQVSILPKSDEGTNVFGEKKRISRIGVKPSQEFIVQKFGPIESIQKSFIATINISLLSYKALWRLVTGRMSPKALSGPIGIMAMTGDAAKKGLFPVLQLAALISISLAVVNLLPIPALDGGHVFFLLVGMLRGKELSHEFQEKVTQVGFAFLMGLMVFVIYNDLSNLGAVSKLMSWVTGLKG